MYNLWLVPCSFLLSRKFISNNVCLIVALWNWAQERPRMLSLKKESLLRTKLLKRDYNKFFFLFFFFCQFNSSENTKIVKTSRGCPGKGKSKKRCALPQSCYHKPTLVRYIIWLFVTPGSSVSNPVECPTGLHCPEGSPDPKACSSGYYTDRTTQYTCKLCPRG